jgi:tetratricopeptide (TPR) repeat protein
MFDDDEGEDYFEGNLNEDVERYELFLKGSSIEFLDSDRLEAVIDHYLMNSHYSKAKHCAEYALTQFSYNSVFSLRLAQAMSAMGQLKEALNVISQVEKREIMSCEIMLTKASIFSQLRDSKLAIKYFKLALELAETEDKDEIYLDLAVEYQNVNDYKNALLVLQTAIKENPHNEGAIYEIAFCYDQLGAYDKAIQCYSDFIDENPYSFTAWYNLGNAYSKSEDYAKAIWAYDYCIIINEDFGPVYFNLGNAYLSNEQFELSIEAFNKCMELDGEDPLALCYIGECHEQLGELVLAKGFYKQSLALAPTLPDAWLGLGIVVDLEGDTQEAITLIKTALELDPENAGIYSVLAGAYEKLGDSELAQENYLMALELDPLDEEALSSYIDLLLELSIPLARKYMVNYCEEYTDNHFAKLILTYTLWKEGRLQEAIHLFSDCVLMDNEKSKEIFELYPDLSNVKAFKDILGE